MSLLVGIVVRFEDKLLEISCGVYKSCIRAEVANQLKYLLSSLRCSRRIKRIEARSG